MPLRNALLVAAGFWFFGSSGASASVVNVQACECLLEPGDQAIVTLDFSNTGASELKLVLLMTLPNGKRLYFTTSELVEAPVPLATLPTGAAAGPLDILDHLLTAQSLPFGNWPLAPPFRYQFHAILIDPTTGVFVAPVATTHFDFAPYDPIGPPTVPGVLHLVPHQHADVAWLDREERNLQDAADWIADSMLEVAEDSSYRFVIDQPFVLKAFEERRPDLVSELQQMIDAGVCEVAGGFYVQPDLNLSSGESLARQVIYGQRYLEERWGTRARQGWNLDSFGHPHQMPQIVRNGGMERYAFSRGIPSLTDLGLSGSEFVWESPDGSSVLANYLPFGYQLGRSVGDEAPDDEELDEVFATLEPTSLSGHFITGNGADVSEDVLNPLLPEAVALWNAVQAPGVEARISTASDFFSAVEQIGVSLPKVSGIEFQDDAEVDDPRIFPGAYASRIEIKKTNQSLEHRLLDAEKVSTMAWIEGKAYPGAELREAGERIAVNQFHDYLPGTGVDEIYDDDDDLVNDLGDRADAVSSVLGQVFSDATRYVADRVDTDLPGEVVDRSFVVFNSMAWDRRDLVEIPVDPASLPTPARLVDALGSEVAFQLSFSISDSASLVFVADVPATGYATYHLVEGEPAETSAESVSVVGSGGVSRPVGAFTAFFAQSGLLRGLFADSTGDPVVLLPAEDPPGDPPAGLLWWGSETLGNSYDYGPALEAGFESPGATALLEGSVSTRLRTSASVGTQSFAVREVRIVPELGRIDFETTVFWGEQNQNLYVRFPLHLHSGARITQGVPYGHMLRGAGHNPALRWADWGSESIGISLLNQGLFGHHFSVEPGAASEPGQNQILDLSLLRSMSRAVFGEFPSQSMKGHGIHRYRYSLVPHHGSWRHAQTPRRAWELGSPLVAVETTTHPGVLPPQRSYLALNPASDAIVSVMQVEGEDVVLRLYETTGEAGEHLLSFPLLDAVTIDKTDFLGGFRETLGSGSGARLRVAPEEIVTLRLAAPRRVQPAQEAPGSSAQQVIDLATADVTRLVGIDDADLAGRALSAIGDINGDGYDDLLIGANQGNGPDNTGDSDGEVYLVFGGPQSRFENGFSLDQADVTLYGARDRGFAGIRVTSGDLDGDGFDEIIIGSLANPDGAEARNASGVTWVVFGGPSGSLASSIDLGDGADLEIWGQPGDIAGVHVTVGDLDADGRDDLIIGAPSGDGKDDAVTSAGEGYIIFGGSRADIIQTGTRVLGLHHDAVIWGAEEFDHTVWAAETGDIDADGYDDIVFGAIDADGSGPNMEAAGDVYIFWGGPRDSIQGQEFLASNLENMNVFYGVDRGDLAGFNFGVDDVDGDGYDDVLIASPFADGQDNAVGDITGEAYLIFGRDRASFAPQNELSEVSDVIFYGAHADDSAGHSVFLADVTGDGLAEVIIGAPVADGFQGQRFGSGTTYVLLGRPQAEWPAEIVLSDQNSDFLIRGSSAYESAGFALSAGDLDGDGFDDLVIGGPFYSEAGENRLRLGATYVLFHDDLRPELLDQVTITRAEYDPETGLLRVAATTSAGQAAFSRENEVFVSSGVGVSRLTDNASPEQRLHLASTSPSDPPRIVWDRFDGQDSEVYVLDGGVEIQLTDNVLEDTHARTDGTHVVWMGYDGNDLEIFFDDGSTVQQLTDNDRHDVLPDVSGGVVTWMGHDGNDFEIFVWDGSTVQALTDNVNSDLNPRISNGHVAWMGDDGSDFEIFVWDGSTVQQLSDNAFSDGSPQTEGGEVAWIGSDGNDFEVFYWDGSTVQQLSDNAIPDQQPQLSGGLVAWSAGVEEQAEIYLFDGSAVVQLTDNAIADIEPVVDGGRVIWRTLRRLEAEKTEVFVHEAGLTRQLTDNNDDETSVVADAGWIAWLADTVETTLTIPGVGDLELDPETGVYSGVFALTTPPDSITVESPLGGTQSVQVIEMPAATTALAITKLTDDGEVRPDRDPQIWGTQMVWSGSDGNDFEIFVDDGSGAIQLTNNEEDDLNPQIHAGQVAWEGFDGNDLEIFLWDGATVRQLTDNGVKDIAPRIHDGVVVWQRLVGSTFEIFVDDAGVQTQLTQNAFNDAAAFVESGVVVWQGYDGIDFEIFRWSGGAVEQLTNNTFDDLEPVLDGGDVYWRGSDGENYEILRHSQGATTPLSNSTQDAFSLSVRGGVAVWQQSDGSDSEIFRWEGGSLAQLTDNEIPDVLPHTDQGSVAWQAIDGADFDIFLYDAGSTTTQQLSQNSAHDEKPRISGGRVVWTGPGADPNDTDIFLFDGATTRNVTNNSEAIPDTRPHVAAGIVAWQRWEGDPEIVVHDGLTTQQLSSNDFEELRARVDPVTGLVVWQALDDVRMRFDDPGAGEGGQGATIIGGDFEIFAWDGQAVSQLTDRDKLDDAAPWVHAGQILWVGGDGNDLEVFFWDGATIQQLTDNDFAEGAPHLHAGRGVWEGWDGQDMEIFYWDGATVQQLTDNDATDVGPQIHGDDVVWVGWDGSDFEIFRWNAQTGVTTQVTTNTGNDVDAQVASGVIAWQGFDGEDFEIFVNDGAVTTQLSDNALLDERPRLAAGRVVWQTFDGFDLELFYWDGSQVLRLTDNTGDDKEAEISDGAIVWQGFDGRDFEIFRADLP